MTVQCTQSCTSDAVPGGCNPASLACLTILCSIQVMGWSSEPDYGPPPDSCSCDTMTLFFGWAGPGWVGSNTMASIMTQVYRVTTKDIRVNNQHHKNVLCINFLVVPTAAVDHVMYHTGCAVSFVHPLWNDIIYPLYQHYMD